VITCEMLDRIARRRRFAPRTLHVARRLLVDGTPARIVASEFGLHLSRIYAMRRQVLDAARSMKRPPLPVARPAAPDRSQAGPNGRTAA
jgi:hypothetical protein